MRKWATELNVKEIDGMGVKSKEILINSLDIDWNQPVLLNGLTNVWYWCYTLRGEFAYLHCVKTSFE